MTKPDQHKISYLPQAVLLAALGLSFSLVSGDHSLCHTLRIAAKAYTQGEWTGMSMALWPWLHKPKRQIKHDNTVINTHSEGTQRLLFTLLKKLQIRCLCNNRFSTKKHVMQNFE